MSFFICLFPSYTLVIRTIIVQLMDLGSSSSFQNSRIKRGGGKVLVTHPTFVKEEGVAIEFKYLSLFFKMKKKELIFNPFFILYLLHIVHTAHWTVLHCTSLLCTVLQCTTLYCSVLHCTALYYTVLYRRFVKIVLAYSF